VHCYASKFWERIGPAKQFRLNRDGRFSFGQQSKSSSPGQSRLHRKQNGEAHANTYAATSVRSKDAIGDDPAEIEPEGEELALAMLRQSGSK
jgi:hypothetical protein